MTWTQTFATGKIGDTGDYSIEGAVKVKKIALTAQDGTDETDTSFDLPADAIVLDVLVHVTTAEATGTTKTIDVGTDGTGSNDPDGFMNDLDVSTTGWKRPMATVTTGDNETYFSANTRGALLASFVAGTDAAGDVGTYLEKPDMTSGGESVTWSAGSAQTEFAGELYIVYMDLG